jgi:hypothetical protein
VLATTSAVALTSGIGLAVTAQPASAVINNQSPCGTYLRLSNYWSNRAMELWVNGTAAEFDYAVNQSLYWDAEFSAASC